MEGNGRFPFISSLLKRSEVGLQIYNGGHATPSCAWRSLGNLFWRDLPPTRTYARLLVPVSATTHDQYRNHCINKQKWNHIAPWERKHRRAVTSVAVREGWMDEGKSLGVFIRRWYISIHLLVTEVSCGALPRTDVSTRFTLWRRHEADQAPLTGNLTEMLHWFIKLIISCPGLWCCCWRWRGGGGRRSWHALVEQWYKHGRSGVISSLEVNWSNIRVKTRKTAEQHDQNNKWMTERLSTVGWKTSDLFESKGSSSWSVTDAERTNGSLKARGEWTNPRPEGFF